MRHSYHIKLATFSFFAMYFNTNTLAEAQNAAADREAKIFISENCKERLHQVDPENINHFYTIDYMGFSLEKSAWSWKYKEYSSDPSGASNTITGAVSLNPGMLSKNISLVTSHGLLAIHIECYQGKCIRDSWVNEFKGVSRIFNNESITSGESEENKIEIICNSDEYTQRAAKAFQYLIEVSGGRSPLF